MRSTASKTATHYFIALIGKSTKISKFKISKFQNFKISKVKNSNFLKNSKIQFFFFVRHEPPVFGEVEIVGESESFLAVSKPPSLPMHPCGAYRFNSLEYLLKAPPSVSSSPSPSSSSLCPSASTSASPCPPSATMNGFGGSGKQQSLHIVHRLDRFSSELSD
jgi:23S rRNA-/tRNA-specific pseudouridylate synthase